MTLCDHLRPFFLKKKQTENLDQQKNETQFIYIYKKVYVRYWKLNEIRVTL